MPSPEYVATLLARHGLTERFGELWEGPLFEALIKRIAELEAGGGVKPAAPGDSVATPDRDRLEVAALRYGTAATDAGTTPMTFLATEGELKAAAVRFAAGAKSK